MLAEDFDIGAEVWSVPSFTELAREGMEVERWNRLHPGETARRSYVAEQLGDGDAPVVAATDYMRTFAEQIRPYVPAPYKVLGTDGFGRSDWRRVLRRFFEVDAQHVAIAALGALAERGEVEPKRVTEAIERYEIETEADPPWRR
jgi:pyruvate dehydrogenase E1 component